MLQLPWLVLLLCRRGEPLPRLTLHRAKSKAVDLLHVHDRQARPSNAREGMLDRRPPLLALISSGRPTERGEGGGG